MHGMPLPANPATVLTFTYVTHHVLQSANDLVDATPVLPADNRLYVMVDSSGERNDL